MLFEMTTAQGADAREITVAGRHLRCQVCDYTRFFRREARVTAGASFFGQEWANIQAECFVCEQCGYVHWFMRSRPVSTDAEASALAGEIEQLRSRLEAEFAEGLEITRS